MSFFLSYTAKTTLPLGCTRLFGNQAPYPAHLMQTSSLHLPLSISCACNFFAFLLRFGIRLAQYIACLMDINISNSFSVTNNSLIRNQMTYKLAKNMFKNKYLTYHLRRIHSPRLATLMPVLSSNDNIIS
jgi:hypothetical protein